MQQSSRRFVSALCALVAALAASLAVIPSVFAAEPVRLFAAGSLQAALGEVAKAYTQAGGAPVMTEFAPSGLLRERILGGEAADVFASANLEHPRALAAERGGEVRPFARNSLCALAQPELAVAGNSLLEVLLDPQVRVGTSTPGADPSGDYAWQLFDKADDLRPGAARILKAKARPLTGGPDSPQPDGPRSVYGWVMEENQADIFLTYCTNAAVAAREVAGLKVVNLPPALEVGADYGLIVLGDRTEARDLADFVLSPRGQSILARHGFGAPQ